MVDIPVIDLSADEEIVVEGLAQAYSEFGFAGVVGHRIDRRLHDEIFEQARRFHALDHGEKQRIALNEHHRGYIAKGTSTDSASEYEQVKTPNQSESFIMLSELPAESFLSGPNQWPELDGFRDVVEAYRAAVEGVARRLIRGFATVLGDKDGVLEDHFAHPTAWLRLLRYPAAEGPGYGSAPHRDYGAITLLAQDGVPGLEVLTPDDEWMIVDPDPEVLIVNTGEVMYRWSNGRLMRTPHRVINASGRERYSIPFFFDPDVRSVIEPLETCVRPGNPPRFEPIRFEDFLADELSAGYKRHRDRLTAR